MEAVRAWPLWKSTQRSQRPSERAGDYIAAAAQHRLPNQRQGRLATEIVKLADCPFLRIAMNKFPVRRAKRASAVMVLCAGLLLAVPPALALTPAATQKAAQGEGYLLPSAALQAVVDAPRAPSLYLSPKRDLTALLQTPALPSIAQVAAPELKLAGLRINPKTWSDSRFSFGNKLWLISTVDGVERQISGLPQPLSVASLAWSPDQKYLAFNQLDPASGRNELWR